MSALNITIGADPEFFLRDKATKALVSAHNIVPGTKVNPHPLRNGGFIQADGTAVEFNIPPAKTAGDFADYIEQALHDIGEFVDRKKYDYVFQPHVKYPKKYFDSIPDEAKALGCDPDYNAYTLQQNPVYEPDHGVRTGSGHLHIGFSEGEDTKDKEYFESCAHLVKFLDTTLVPMEYTWCKDTVRPKLYGKMGNFRPKSYGLEYRTLGNAWLNHKRPELCALFSKTKATVEQLFDMQEKAKFQYEHLLFALNVKNPNAYGYEKYPFSNLKV